MHIYPRRLGRRAGEKIQRANVTGEIVGTEIDNDCGRGSAVLARRNYEDAPESPGREIALERCDSIDPCAGPSPRDRSRAPSLKNHVGIHPESDCTGGVTLARYESSGVGRRFDLDFEACAFDQFARRPDAPSRSGQITIDENRIYRVEDIGLPRAEIQLASAGSAHFALRIEQSKQAGRLQTALRRQSHRML